MKPGDAVLELSRLGFRFRLVGEAIKMRFEGEGRPDPQYVAPLVDLVRQNKDEVRYFLKNYCPRCGGVIFVINECFICSWMPGVLREEAQTQAALGTALTCGGCAHFIPGRLNPTQGFGRCALAHLSKRPGAFPGKAACAHFEAPAGEDSLRLAQ
jgi:hypothetical protein